jgi:hypothetical protein
MERRKFTREFKLDAVRLGTARLFFIIFNRNWRKVASSSLIWREIIISLVFIAGSRSIDFGGLLRPAAGPRTCAMKQLI